MLEIMTAGENAQEWAKQGIDHWAQHGVEELTEREAEERAELGEPEPDARPIPEGG